MTSPVISGGAPGCSEARTSSAAGALMPTTGGSGLRRLCSILETSDLLEEGLGSSPCGGGFASDVRPRVAFAPSPPPSSLRGGGGEEAPSARLPSVTPPSLLNTAASIARSSAQMHAGSRLGGVCANDVLHEGGSESEDC